jgi:hypothetical protein
MLSVVAAVSGIYDVLLGVAMLAGRGSLAQLFGTPVPIPPIHADLNGLFLIAIGVGYAWPWRDPQRYRWYLWVMGPFLKGAGALAFILDVAVRHSPVTFLALAASDGGLAFVTLVALLMSRPPGGRATS